MCAAEIGVSYLKRCATRKKLDMPGAVTGTAY